MALPTLDPNAPDFTRRFVNLSFFDGNLVLVFGRHLRERARFDLYSRLLHAGEDGNERQVDFLINLREPLTLDLGTECLRQPAGDVCGLWKLT